MLTTLAVENYRSLRHLVVPLGALNIVTGVNGSGKSNLYRALGVLADCSRNGAAAALAREGGLPSVLWAGPETTGREVRAGEQAVQGTVRSRRVALRLGFAGEEFGYAIDFGLPAEDGTKTAFVRDPQIKRECIWNGPVLRPAALLVDRHESAVWVRDGDGTWPDRPDRVRGFDSMLSEFADPARAPELLAVRDSMRAWRFYHHFRTDAHAAARRPQVGTRTTVLSHGGADLAAALQTIIEIGDAQQLHDAVEVAFPGSWIEVANRSGWFELNFYQHGLLRPLTGAELSDGTLRYLLWIAALLTPRPPALLVLNEPETSLHPRLLTPLARLVAGAAARTQVIVVSQSQPFVDALADCAQAEEMQPQTIELTKDFSATGIAGQEPINEPRWQWPTR